MDIRADNVTRVLEFFCFLPREVEVELVEGSDVRVEGTRGLGGDVRDEAALALVPLARVSLPHDQVKFCADELEVSSVHPLIRLPPSRQTSKPHRGRQITHEWLETVD